MLCKSERPRGTRRLDGWYSTWCNLMCQERGWVNFEGVGCLVVMVEWGEVGGVSAKVGVVVPLYLRGVAAWVDLSCMTEPLLICSVAASLRWPTGELQSRVYCAYRLMGGLALERLPL